MGSKSNTLIFVLFAAFIVFAACSKFEMKAKGQFYKCVDGREVANLTDCERGNFTKNVTRHPVQNLTNASMANVAKANVTERNFSTFRERKQSNQTSPSNKTGTLPDLNGWSVDEIVVGMSAYDPKLAGIVASPIKYNKADPKYYWYGTDMLHKVYDPFWAARGPFSGGVSEYQKNHFRVWLSQTPKEFFLYVGAKRNDSKFKILYPGLWAEWDAINCSMVNSCRNIDAVQCTRGNHTLWMWTHTTPGAGYTGDTKYNMQAFDDDRETLTAFEKFYCTPV